jgi:hypothetical protein
MEMINLEEILHEEVVKVQNRLGIKDEVLMEDFLNLLANHFDNFSDAEKDILCRVLCGEPREE